MNEIIDNPKFQEIDKKLNSLGYMLLFGAVKQNGMLSLHATPLEGSTPTIEADESTNEIKIKLSYKEGFYSINDVMKIASNIDNALDAAQYLEELVKTKEIFELEKIS